MIERRETANDEEVQVQGGGDAILSSDEGLHSLISEREGGEEELWHEDGEGERQHIVVAFLYKSLWWTVWQRVILTRRNTQDRAEALCFKWRNAEGVLLVFSVYITDSLEYRLHSYQ